MNKELKENLLIPGILGGIIGILILVCLLVFWPQIDLSKEETKTRPIWESMDTFLEKDDKWFHEEQKRDSK